MKGLSKTLLVCGMVINLFFSIVAAATADSLSFANREILTFSDVGANDNNLLFIKYLVNRGLIKGLPDGTFHPTDGLTRAQAATLLCRAVGLTSVKETSRFRDVDVDHWATGSIAAADAAGYLRGYPDGTFHPDTVLSRCEGVSLLLRLSKRHDPGVKLPSLSDFGSEHWAARPVAIGLASGMVGLTADKKQFLPDTPFTRGDLTRALSILLTQDPKLAQTSLLVKLNVLQGTVTVTRNGSQAPSTIKEGVEINPGDTIKTEQGGSAEVIFPDGTGLKLEENTELTIKETRGRFYIQSDGTSGTAVDWLAVDLKNGKMFGSLATRYESGHNDKTKENKTNTVGLKNYPLVAALDNSFLAGSKDLLALEGNNDDNNEIPWWQAQNTKRVRVKVDMPWGVAAIRGTFWENIVNANGSGRTTVLVGEAEVTAAGQRVILQDGLSTEVAKVGTPPVPPAPMTAQDKKEWAQVKDWAMERAKDIQSKQIMFIPPPTSVVEHPEQLQPEVEKQTEKEKTTEQTQTPQLPIENELPTPNVVQNALNDAGISSSSASDTTSTPPSNSGGGGGGGDTYSASNLNSAGTYNSNYTINASGVFGPASGTSTINGTLTLNPGTTGTVTLQNIIASSIVVQSGDSSSIHLKNVIILGEFTVDARNQTNSVHVVLEGMTSIAQSKIKSQVILEALSGSFGDISLESGAYDKTVECIGDINSTINVYAQKVTLQFGLGATIGNLNVVQTADVSLLGQGTVQNIVVKKGATGTNIMMDQEVALTVNLLTLQDNISLSGNIGGISSVTGDSGVIIKGGQQDVVELNGYLDDVDSDYKTLKLNIFADGDSEASVTKNLKLLLIGEKGTNIMWSKANPPDVIALDGTIKRPGVGQADVSVTLTAIITKGKVTKTVSYVLTVKSLTPIIQNEAPTAKNVAITGQPVLGQSLIGSYMFFDSDDDYEGATTYKWYVGTVADGTGKTVITGVYGKLYTLSAEDVGKYIFFEVTPVAVGGVSPGTAVVSPAVGPVTITPPPNTAPVANNVKIFGQPVVGRTLTGNYSYSDADNDLEGESVYNWYIGAVADGTGKTVINGANGKAYILSAGDAGKYIFFEVTPVAIGGVSPGTAAVSPAVGPVTITPPPNTAPIASNVKIIGQPVVGQLLIANYSYADADNDLEGESVYKWYIGTVADGTGKTVIIGENGKTYTLSAGDAGKYIFFEVTPVAVDGVSPGTAVSVGTGPVQVFYIISVTCINGTVAISGTTNLNEVSIKVICPNNNILYVEVVKVNNGVFNNTFIMPAGAEPGTYTVVVGKGTTVSSKTFIFNKVSCNVSYSSDIVIISGATSLKEVSIKVIAPNNTILYLEVIPANNGIFSNTFSMPFDAEPGTYTVVVGQGTTVTTGNFIVSHYSGLTGYVS